MNVKEFAALRPGDKIVNPALSGRTGVVTEIDHGGVWVRWHEATDAIHFSVQSTIWFMWQYAPRECTLGPCYRDDCRRGDQCLGGDYATILKGGA